MLSVTGPMGNYENPDPDMLSWIRSRLVDAAGEFWARNQGDVGFFSSGSYLVLSFVRGHGYHVLYKGPGNRADSKLAWIGGDNTPVEVSFGGGAGLVPARAFVSPEVAWQIVEQFRESGELPIPPAGAEWREQLDIAAV